jgi:FAD/FMN-containing dehydrogenase
VNKEALTQLAARITGVAVSKENAEYDEARRLWNGTLDKRPAVIVKCKATSDVAEALQFARKQGLGVSIRGGGHHVAGGAVLNDGLVVDLSEMRAVSVDPTTNTVRAEGGAWIRDVDHAAFEHGLVVPLGLFSETGIAGITLGGGLGWFRRKYGMTCDSLIGADVVTADGRAVHASADENADLFWALRGGGWDMGVVTAFHYRAQPIEPENFLLFVTYPIEEGRTILKRFGEFMSQAKDEVGVLAVIWTFPEAEAYPKEVWGKQFVALAGPYAGTVEEGERALQPLRELGTILLDMSGPSSYVAIQALFDEEYPVGRRYYWKSSYLSGLSDDTIETLLARGRARPSPLSSVDIWALGGALARVSPQETPIHHREAPFMAGIEANWDDPAGDKANIAWTRETVAALAPYSTGGSYLNFEDLSEGGVVERSHGANLDRLAEIKRKYDPDNLFRSRRLT